MASFSTWVCRRSEEFRYGLFYSVLGPWYFISIEAGKKSSGMGGKTPLRKQAIKIFCVRKRLEEAQEVYRAGRTGQVQGRLRENGGIQREGKAISVAGGNPCWGIQRAEKR